MKNVFSLASTAIVLGSTLALAPAHAKAAGMTLHCERGGTVMVDAQKDGGIKLKYRGKTYKLSPTNDSVDAYAGQGYKWVASQVGTGGTLFRVIRNEDRIAAKNCMEK